MMVLFLQRVLDKKYSLVHSTQRKDEFPSVIGLLSYVRQSLVMINCEQEVIDLSVSEFERMKVGSTQRSHCKV